MVNKVEGGATLYKDFVPGCLQRQNEAHTQKAKPVILSRMKLYLTLVIGLLFLQAYVSGFTIDKSLNITEHMWNTTEADRNRVMLSTFVTTIRVGNLDPTEFGVFNLQDAVYLRESAESFRIAATRTVDPDVKRYLEEQYAVLYSYADSMFTTWHGYIASDIKLGDAMSGYTAYERNVSETMDPVYFLVAMIPCYRLWPWIGTHIDATKAGLYESWVEYNFGPSKAYVALEEKVNERYTNGTLDVDIAMEVYRTCMGYEAAFFESSAVKNRNVTGLQTCAAARASLNNMAMNIMSVYFWLTIQTKFL